LGLGDAAAFAALYEAHLGRVYRHIYYFVRSKTEAEDLTAQTFLQAWKARSRYEERGKPVLSWLLTIAHNLVVSYYRNGHSERSLAEAMVAPGHSLSPEEASVAKVECQEIMNAILALKPVERQVILLRFVDGMEYADVAQVLRKSINAVRVIQYRALRSLRGILEAGR